MTSRIELPFGCYITDEEMNFTDEKEHITITVGRNVDDIYIGNEKMTRLLVEEHGISPEPARKGDQICSIGYSEKHDKWFGWSHRAIYGFTVGSNVEVGDCGYQAPDKESFGQSMLDFFCSDDWYTNRSFITDVRDKHTGTLGVMISAKYTDDVPNEKLRGTFYNMFWPYPEEFGSGEWNAKTMEDAKQMAIDFADGVA